jgi:phosphatidylinositol alpha-1,6-mannosyltransferase
VEIVPPGIDPARFLAAQDTGALRQQHGADGPILLSVGGLKARKGQDVALRAFGRVKQAVPSAQYWIVGDGHWRSRLESLAHALGLADSVRFMGRVDDEVLPIYYHASDLFVLTPRLINWNFEGFGLVYLEAAACGKPCVASRSGGVEDAVLDGETGLLVPEADVEATAEAVIRLLHDPGLARRLGENARSRAGERTVTY